MLRASDIAVYAISYDPPDVLGQLARGYAVTYPLLSDQRSRVIGALGLLNPNMPVGHHWHGVPYPGTFLLDARGRITHKSFYADHRVRDSVARLLEEGFGVPPDLDVSPGTPGTPPEGNVAGRRRPRVAARTERVEAVATLSAGTVRPGQVHSLRIEIWPRADAPVVPAHQLPQLMAPTVEVAPEEGVEAGSTLSERLDGRMVLRTPITVRRRADVVLHVRVKAFAAGDRVAQDAGTLAFDLPLRFLPNAAPATG